MSPSNPLPDFLDEAAALFPDITEEYSVLSELSRHLLAKRKADGLERAVLFQCGIAWQHYHAIILLLSQRFGMQSLVLCRTLFELVVGTLYLLKTPSLLPDFLDCGKLVLYQQAIAAGLSERDMAPFKSECEQIKSRLKKEKVKQWHRSTIKRMAEAVRFDVLYEKFYPDASAAAHSDATPTLSHGAGGWRQSLRRFGSEQECDFVSYMSFQLIGFLFFRANKAFDLGNDKEANAVMNLVLSRARSAAMPN